MLRGQPAYLVGEGAELVRRRPCVALRGGRDGGLDLGDQPACPLHDHAVGHEAFHLLQQGFETIYHFDSGIVAWEGEIERGAAASAPTESAQEAAGENEAATSEGEGAEGEAAAAAIPVMYEFYTDT